MPQECLDQVAALLESDRGADTASLYHPIDDPDEIRDPSAVKVVVDEQGRALYFSRSVIPAHRQWASVDAAVKDGCSWKRHIGLYAYRARALKRFAGLGPTPLERMERLEQLRILESGGVIAMAQAVRPVAAGVDTAADLERVRRAFQ
jgi:3-deoxy-manno-octulosonate cytidylyltransferase (CMP-KDO synthetase)